MDDPEGKIQLIKYFKTEQILLKIMNFEVNLNLIYGRRRLPLRKSFRCLPTSFGARVFLIVPPEC